MEYQSDEYCNILLTLDAELELHLWIKLKIILDNVIQILMCLEG
jgi:hypothetical protein